MMRLNFVINCWIVSKMLPKVIVFFRSLVYIIHTLFLFSFIVYIHSQYTQTYHKPITNYPRSTQIIPVHHQYLHRQYNSLLPLPEPLILTYHFINPLSHPFLPRKIHQTECMDRCIAKTYVWREKFVSKDS